MYVRPHPTDMICPGEASGNRKARVPWASLSEQQDNFLDTEFLPDGLELKEPSKIHRNDITRIITHCKERQDNQEKSMLKPTVHRRVQPESDREADRPNPRKSQRIPPAAPEPTAPWPKPKPAYKKVQPVKPRVTKSSEKRTADGDPEARSSKKQKSNNTGLVEEEADLDRNKK